MVVNLVCKLNKYGHCKFGQFCHFMHVNNKCLKKTCDSRNCDLRHPKKFINVLRNKTCKFGIFCSFEHENLEQTPPVDHAIEKDLKKRIQKLEEALVTKDHEISDLNNKIFEMEQAIKFKFKVADDIETEKTDSDSDTDSESRPGDLTIEGSELEDSSIENYECDFCEFESVHLNGIKVHIARKHKIKCDECRITFEAERSLIKLRKSKKYPYLVNIQVT